MDIRFIAAIFLIAALMEFLSKLAKKRRGEEELEEREAPRVADPLAGVLEEMRRLSPGDEGEREVGMEAADPSERARRTSGGEVGFRAPEPPREPVTPVRPGPRERSAAHVLAPPARAQPTAEPVTLRGQIERMFEPVPQAPTPSLVAEAPPPPKPVVARRDRSPRPSDVRSREVRPRRARDIAERAWTEERDATGAELLEIGAAEGRGRVETRRGGEEGGLDLGSVRGLRRLVVAREVLGPPLALRGEEPFTER